MTAETRNSECLEAGVDAIATVFASSSNRPTQRAHSTTYNDPLWGLCRPQATAWFLPGHNTAFGRCSAMHGRLGMHFYKTRPASLFLAELFSNSFARCIIMYQRFDNEGMSRVLNLQKIIQLKIA